jgi:hypothetical protein
MQQLKVGQRWLRYNTEDNVSLIVECTSAELPAGYTDSYPGKVVQVIGKQYSKVGHTGEWAFSDVGKYKYTYLIGQDSNET